MDWWMFLLGVLLGTFCGMWLGYFILMVLR
jgi:hypothetical protein